MSARLSVPETHETPRPAHSRALRAGGCRHKRDSWQVWENYSQAAVRAKEYAHAAHGLKKVRAPTHLLVLIAA
jgi:hypothetical protein